MIYGGGLLAFITLVLWVYCILDVIATEESLVRNMPKVLWLVIVIFLPTIGSVAWLALGRPANASLRPGDSSPRRAPRLGDSTPRALRRPLGPEDSPEFMGSLGERESKLRDWEEDLKRREEELRRRRDDGGNGSSS